jgi:ferredoxin-NADP reductase
VTDLPRPTRWQTAKAVAVWDETPRVRSIAFEVGTWPGHLAGQHVDVRLTAEDGYRAERSYSIASPPEQPRIELTVERLKEGEVSPYLTEELRAGDTIELRGPIGGAFTWVAGRDGNPLVLVAGGSGIVPLMAMLRHRRRSGGAVPARLFYSSRSLPDVIYRKELEALAAADPAFRLTIALTREQPAGWAGPARRIDRDLIASFLESISGPVDAYVCGPTPFVETAATHLQELSDPASVVRTERFGPTGS